MITPKRIIKVLAISILLISTACSNSKRSQLKLIVENINNECPVAFGDLSIFESAQYSDKDNDVVLTLLIDEDKGVSINSLYKASEYQKEFIGAYLHSDVSYLLDGMISADASLSVKYKGIQTADSLVLMLSNKELKSIAESYKDEDTSMKSLELLVASANASCPEKIDEGIVMTGVAIADGYISYYYTYNSDSIKFEESKYSLVRDAIHENLKENKLTDKSFAHELDLMVKCGIGLQYIYKADSDSSDCQTFTIAPDELAEL